MFANTHATCTATHAEIRTATRTATHAAIHHCNVVVLRQGGRSDLCSPIHTATCTATHTETCTATRTATHIATHTAMLWYYGRVGGVVQWFMLAKIRCNIYCNTQCNTYCNTHCNTHCGVVVRVGGLCAFLRFCKISTSIGKGIPTRVFGVRLSM